MQIAVLGFSLPIFGIFFAPVYTPHLSERFGRVPVYFVSLPLFAIFTSGSGLAQNFATLAICRFLAGLSGGPIIVLIEGTFADVWEGKGATVSYYSVLTLASFIGTACGEYLETDISQFFRADGIIGPLIGGFVFAAKGWRWLQWVTLMVCLLAYLFGLGVPETYGREILRQRARNLHMPPPTLAPAESGVTLGAMARVTILNPIKMLVADPITIGISLYLGFNFAVLFSFFISIPVVLESTYNFTVQQVGIAFTAAIAGSLLAALMSISMDRITARVFLKRGTPAPLEYRLLPALVGGVFILASLFWIAWTASPNTHYASPILGTLLYVWGNMSVLISAISYLFDAYPPRGTLSALTAAACTRLACAGIVSLFIIPMIMGLTGAWAYSLFGFISAAMVPLPWLLFRFGPTLRARSNYGAGTALMQGKVTGQKMASDDIRVEMRDASE
jgi:DHA1 family multidrug resistance protein-like MFS transporter